jgi:hypothetical protein
MLILFVDPEDKAVHALDFYSLLHPKKWLLFIVTAVRISNPMSLLAVKRKHIVSLSCKRKGRKLQWCAGVWFYSSDAIRITGCGGL